MTPPFSFFKYRKNQFSNLSDMPHDPLRPILPSMFHVQNLNYVCINAIHDNVIVMHDHLSRSGNAPCSI
ncbi:hypothetical protein BURPS305_7379 [Burkholderia pseudomallei 305]|nr:hypothetical protein BURPS305_7379 [Burkholderia pseudomallei 305]